MIRRNMACTFPINMFSVLGGQRCGFTSVASSWVDCGLLVAGWLVKCHWVHGTSLEVYRFMIFMWSSLLWLLLPGPLAHQRADICPWSSWNPQDLTSFLTGRRHSICVEVNWISLLTRDAGQGHVYQCTSHNLKENSNLMHNGRRD